MEKELLRNRSILRILGTGSIALVLWTAFKPVLVLLAIPGEQIPIGTAPEEIEEETIAALLLLLIAGLVVVTRLWIGLSARAEGMGKPRGKAYMVLAFLIFAFQVLLFLITVVGIFFVDISEESVFETAASLMVEIMSMAATGELAFTARKVKKLSRTVH